jgi:hypothetical protein
MGCHTELYIVPTQKNNEPDPLKHNTDEYPCVFATQGWKSPLNLLIEKVRQRDGVPDVWGIQVWLTKNDLIELVNASDDPDREELQFVWNMNENDVLLAQSG